MMVRPPDIHNPVITTIQLVAVIGEVCRKIGGFPTWRTRTRSFSSSSPDISKPNCAFVVFDIIVIP